VVASFRSEGCDFAFTSVTLSGLSATDSLWRWIKRHHNVAKLCFFDEVDKERSASYYGDLLPILTINETGDRQ
jgi:hypothetical protein